MAFPYFSGKGTERNPDIVNEIPPPRQEWETLPAYYEADKELRDAVNVALLMGKPLLLTGKPGTGKTRLAHRLAWELGIDPPLEFETKSVSTAKDLFYTYNVLDRFYDAQCMAAPDAAARGFVSPEDDKYIEFRALGKAILLASDPPAVKRFMPDHPGKRRSVVLIDEIDKAPRDFPNDILNEIERMFFRIPEMGNATIVAEKSLSPVVVITSNSEKHLPDPFLRRCVYHHIRFPDETRMARIVENRIREIPDRHENTRDMSEEFLHHVVRLFYDLRDHLERNHMKPPATAELIVYIQVLRELSETGNPVAEDREAAVKCLGTLIKTGETEDLDRAREFVRTWNAPRKK